MSSDEYVEIELDIVSFISKFAVFYHGVKLQNLLFQDGGKSRSNPAGIYVVGISKNPISYDADGQVGEIDIKTVKISKNSGSSRGCRCDILF